MGDSPLTTQPVNRMALLARAYAAYQAAYEAAAKDERVPRYVLSLYEPRIRRLTGGVGLLRLRERISPDTAEMVSEQIQALQALVAAEDGRAIDPEALEVWLDLFPRTVASLLQPVPAVAVAGADRLAAPVRLPMAPVARRSPWETSPRVAAVAGGRTSCSSAA